MRPVQPLVPLARQADRGRARSVGGRHRVTFDQRPQRDEQHHQHRCAHGRCGCRRRGLINGRLYPRGIVLAALTSTRLTRIPHSHSGCTCRSLIESVEDPYITLHNPLSVSFSPASSLTRTHPSTRSRCATLAVPYDISLPPSSFVSLDVELGLFVPYHRNHSFTYIVIRSFISSGCFLPYTCCPSPLNAEQCICSAVLASRDPGSKGCRESVLSSVWRSYERSSCSIHA